MPGQPKPNETVVSEFDLDAAFKSYFDKNRTPAITGIGFGVDTSRAGRGGAAQAFIKSIEFIGADGSDTSRPTVSQQNQTATIGQLGRPTAAHGEGLHALYQRYSLGLARISRKFGAAIRAEARSKP